MSTKFIYNLPIISIMTPFILAFVLGLFKEKYIQAKRVLTIIATSISFICVLLLINPIFIENKVIVTWMGNWLPIKGNAYGICIEIDALGLFLGLIITGASFLSSIYSLKYMSKDNG